MPQVVHPPRGRVSSWEQDCSRKPARVRLQLPGSTVRGAEAKAALVEAVHRSDGHRSRSWILVSFAVREHQGEHEE